MPAESTSFLPQPPARIGGALTFGALFALESFARAVNSSVLSLQAYDLLGSSQKVSELSTVVSLAVLLASLAAPLLLTRIPRRWGYSIGIFGLMAGSVCLALHTLPGQALGMALRSTGASLLNITLALYILDHVKKADLTRVEPLRLSLSTASWMLGPALGVWLYVRHGPLAPQLLAIAASFALLALFWTLRLHDHGIIRKATSKPPSPIANIGRFLAQPRLRLAWLIAFGRSCFWATFFIYGPIFMVESGLGKQAGGYLISLSQALLVFAVAFGRIARRTGVRVVIAAACAACAAGLLAAGLAGTAAPYAAAGCLLVAALAAAALDGVGGIPFLRAVRARERAGMASVYRSYLDFSELVPSLIFAVVLSFFPLGSVFIITGAWLAVVAAVAWRHLPKGM